MREHLLKTTVGSSTINSVESEDLNRQFEALDRLCRNIYAEKYSRHYTATASGLTPSQCSQILSTEFLQTLEEK